MDPPRHYISRALRSPTAWIGGLMLGFIALATAASSSNHSHYGYRIRSFHQIFVLDLEVLKRENDFDLMIGKCYCNCNWWYCNCNCHNGTVEQDWIIPEGFSAIMNHLEETTSNESSLSENDKDQNKQIIPTFDEQKKMEDDLNKADYNLTSQRKQVTLKQLEELQTELGEEEARIDRKIKNIEANLEKLTMQHLSAREELKALAEKVIITEKNVAELHEQNLQVMSYMNNSKEELKSHVSDVRKEKLDYHDARYLPQVTESEQVLKNTDISGVRNALAAAHTYIANLKRLMKSKEQEIIEATTRLKEEENRVLTMQRELHDVKVLYYAAMSSAEKIAQWANEVVVAMKNDKESVGMEIEVEMMKESLREREMELPKEL